MVSMRFPGSAAPDAWRKVASISACGGITMGGWSWVERPGWPKPASRRQCGMICRRRVGATSENTTMADIQEARVPDIGGHKNVPVIEVLVKVGDAVKKDQGLVTLESDKATMEVPAPFAGIVREVRLKVGDEVSEGVVVALIEAGEAAPVATGKVA